MAIADAASILIGMTEHEATSPSLPPNLAPGILIADRYELVRKLGSGAMGEVWAAHHRSLHEDVAIKLVLRQTTWGDGSCTDDRFLLEGRIAAQLSRKTRHIVSVTDHGEDGPYAYMAMELLDGEALDARVERLGRLDLDAMVRTARAIARGLTVAHEAGVVHRDLKGSNVFLTKDEHGKELVKILDFGIAKLRDTSPAKTSGYLLGTPGYMSPEQAKGRELDPRADVWALSVLCFYMLAGEFPFDGVTAEELLARIIRGTPAPLARYRPDLPPELGAVFARAFARDIDRRYQTAKELVGALEQARAIARRALGEPIPQDEDPLSVSWIAGVPRRGSFVRRVGMGLAALVLLGGLGSLLKIYYEPEPAPRAPAPLVAAAAPPPALDIPPPPEPLPAPPPTAHEEEAHAPAMVAAPRPMMVPPPQPELMPARSTPAPVPRNVDRSDIF